MPETGPQSKQSTVVPDPRRVEELRPWLCLAEMNWLGATVRAGMINEFETAEGAFRASPDRLAQVSGMDQRRLDRFLKERRQATPICDPVSLLASKTRVITPRDDEYPELLLQTPDFPVVLFAQGPSRVDRRPHLAIVGARQATQQGFDIARQFGRELAAAGFVIVSGLALGIDTFAHLGALEAHGSTISVLGCGPDIAYPSTNRRIRDQIAEKGKLVSEYPPGTVARPWHFPQRNRIIAGMCIGTLVVEASAQSGSLITARLAADYDRDVFAIPGNIRSQLAQGTLALLQDGAHLVTEPQALVEHYAHLLPPPEEDSERLGSPEPTLSPEEQLLVERLRDDPVPVDVLLTDGRWDRSKLFSLLLSLEMRDILVKFPGNLYQAKTKARVR